MADTRYLVGAYITIEPRSSAARVPITQPLAPRSNVQYSDQYSTDLMYPPDPRYELSTVSTIAIRLFLLFCRWEFPNLFCPYSSVPRHLWL
jgi:hypothetical protein